MSGLERLDGYGLRRLARGRRVLIERAGMEDVTGTYLDSEVYGANEFVIVVRRDSDHRKQMYGAASATIWINPDTAIPAKRTAHMYWPMITMLIALIFTITPNPIWIALAVWYLHR